MKKKPRQKQLPLLSYDIACLEDYDEITNHPEIRKSVYGHLVSAVEYGILAGKPRVDLFRIHNTDTVITLDKDKWKHTINKAIRFYTDMEEYEKCLDCQELLSRL